MASAVPPSVASTKETSNYARLCRLLLDVGSQALRDTFDGIHPPVGLHGVLARHPEHATLQSLRKRKILNPTQWGKLYPTVASSVSSGSFDITLLMVLLRNICGLHPPVAGWDSFPLPTDTSKEAHIARVKYYRNTVFGHASQASVDDTMFNTYWQDISTSLVALGGASYGAAINKLKNECMDPDMEEHYTELLKQWKKDEDSIKDKLEEIEDKIRNGFEQMKSEIRNLNDKLDTLVTERGNEDQARDDFQQMRSELQNITEKLNSHVPSRGIAKDEGTRKYTLRDSDIQIPHSDTHDSDNLYTYQLESTRDKLEEIKVEIETIKEKLDTLSNLQPPVKKKPRMEDDFVQAEIIDGIRLLYKSREGWLAPFPWCEEFHFHLEDIFTRLKVVSRKKTRGTATTDTVNMSGIFKPHEECAQPRTVLIEGKPGMGKTTYCKKLVYDWATGKQLAENCFPMFDTVLLLRCRDMRSDLWEAIDDQLLPRDVEEDVRKSFFNFIRHNQSKVLLILDGLDEVPENTLPMFSEIIQGRVLPKCRLVGTARHEAGIKVRIHCDTLLEIEGFTEEDVGDFIFKYFNNVEGLAEKLLHKLEDDENLLEMAANPLNTALLCLFCEEFQGVFPESRTKLYLEIVQCVLRRYMQKKGLSDNSEDLIEVYKPQLKHLGQIALNGLHEDNLDFEESELERHAADLPGFGFLSVQLGDSKLRPHRRYAFLHKSFQEFFAAFYLCCQLLNKEISSDSLVADRRYLHELKEVLKFTCGLLAARCEETATALVKSMTTLVNKEDHPERFPVVLECINECKKDNSDFHLTLARVSGSLLELQTLSLETETDCKVVVLAEALKGNSCLTQLKLSHNSIGDAGATALAEALRENSTLTVLNLFYNKIGDAGATGVAKALRQNSTLTKLLLSENAIGDTGAADLAEALGENSSLTELYLFYNNIGSTGATALAEALRGNSRLTVLDLSRNNTGDAGATGLAEALRQNSSLRELRLSDNDIGDAGATGLAQALRQNSSLTLLDLSGNFIGAAGAAGLAAALRQNSTLTKLALSGNNTGDADATGLAEALQENSSSTELNLSENKIGDAGAAALAEALRQNSSLTELNLSENYIGDTGAACLAEALSENSSLTELDLSHNNICDTGATGLADALRQNSSLTKLCLSKNNIGDAGAACLAEALREKSSVKLTLFENSLSKEVVWELRKKQRLSTYSSSVI